MPRPRKNDPSPLLRPLLDQFAMAVANAVSRATFDRVRSALDAQARDTVGGAARASTVRARPLALCYYPGCKNVAAPRFGMFCAALHKNLSATEKTKYRAQRSAGRPVAAARRARKKR
jgi:hypothetical protein